ncbi:MAG: FMN-binding glutamate synthase family protein [Methanophagales archaeon]|nr:FMN-binding glutamate synthase family protein [Methanophagales archaeon]
MPDIYANARSTTGTSVRRRDVNTESGMCPICVKECTVLCEIGKSAFRGREVLYPESEQFGWSTAASNKDYRLDWSDFNILSRLRGAEGIEPDPDIALFHNVKIESTMGGIPLRLPLACGAFGSTDVGKNNWDALAIGAALSGIIIIIGENVCGVDKESVFTNGKVTKSPEMERRVRVFKEYWDAEYGDIAVQTNVEDQRFGVDEYVVSKLDVKIVERKWGQGAKAIGGEIRVSSLDRALELKKRGYYVLPDPEADSVKVAFKDGLFKTFERHSRVGFPTERDFIEDVEWLRDIGAKYVSIKTGAYRPVDVAWTIKMASEAHVDYVTFDGAGGGTGMSPVPMMNEMSTPTVYLEAQVLKCAQIMEQAGRYVPDIGMAGGFINETQMFKAIALSNFDGNQPFVKSITMARSPLTAAMKACYFSDLAEKGRLPRDFANKYGNNPGKFFIAAEELRREYGAKLGAEIPWSAVGVYTYLSERLGLGLKQLLAGTRKFKLDLIDRNDLAALSQLASEVTGIPMMHEVEQDLLEGILLG